MKYKIATAGKKCCKDCTWILALEKQENGYDLIQFKRGFSENRDLMRLYPGEPAIILDTGEFFIGDAAGNPILINSPGGPVGTATGSVLCTRNKEGWSQGSTIEVRYSDMITSNRAPVSASDGSFYGCIVLIDENDVPVGVGFKSNWNYTSNSATFVAGYFGSSNLTEFTDDDIQAIISRAESQVYGD